MEYFEVADFDAHLAYMEGFHRRYMTTRRALSAWAAMVRQLDIDIIAPQHGAVFRGKAMVKRFIDWADNLECGIDVMMHLYQVPTALQSDTPVASVAPAPVAAPPPRR
jgi:flavorubredoxin